MTGLFIKSGPVVQVRDEEGKVQVDNDPDPGIAYDGPLLVFMFIARGPGGGAGEDRGEGGEGGEAEVIGAGTVERVVLNRERFLARLGGSARGPVDNS